MHIPFQDPQHAHLATCVLKSRLSWLGRDDGVRKAEGYLAAMLGEEKWTVARKAVREDWKENAASRLAEAASIPLPVAEDCVRLMSLGRIELDGESLLSGLAFHLGGHPMRDAMVRFFSERPYLHRSLDAALRMRKAGKQDRGLAAAARRGEADILDVLRLVGDKATFPEAAERRIVRALGVYYSLRTNRTVEHDGFVMDDPGVEELARQEPDALYRLAGLLSSKGPETGFQLNHLVAADVVRSDHLPVPRDMDELRACVSVARMVRTVAVDFMHAERPLECHFSSTDMVGRSWADTESLLAMPWHGYETVEAAHATLEEFVEAYGPEDTCVRGMIGWTGTGFADFVGACAAILKMSDAEIAAYAITNGKHDWESPDGALQEAAEAYMSGAPKRRARPVKDGLEEVPGPELMAVMDDVRAQWEAIDDARS